MGFSNNRPVHPPVEASELACAARLACAMTNHTVSLECYGIHVPAARNVFVADLYKCALRNERGHKSQSAGRWWRCPERERAAAQRTNPVGGSESAADDDEHCSGDDGIFNIEGACYAKTIDVSREDEPEIFDAFRFGAVLENVSLDPASRDGNLGDTSITKNTRGSYPIKHVQSAKVPCVGRHPKNLIFLACDVFSVRLPFSKLNSDQAMYHFVSGYTAKVAGTEMGVTDPEATFSPCSGGSFLVWHPAKYAELLRDVWSRVGRRPA